MSTQNTPQPSKAAINPVPLDRPRKDHWLTAKEYKAFQKEQEQKSSSGNQTPKKTTTGTSHGEKRALSGKSRHQYDPGLPPSVPRFGDSGQGTKVQREAQKKRDFEEFKIKVEVRNELSRSATANRFEWLTYANEKGQLRWTTGKQKEEGKEKKKAGSKVGVGVDDVVVEEEVLVMPPEPGSEKPKVQEPVGEQKYGMRDLAALKDLNKRKFEPKNKGRESAKPEKRDTGHATSSVGSRASVTRPATAKEHQAPTTPAPKKTFDAETELWSDLPMTDRASKSQPEARPEIKLPGIVKQAPRLPKAQKEPKREPKPKIKNAGDTWKQLEAEAERAAASEDVQQKQAMAQRHLDISFIPEQATPSPAARPQSEETAGSTGKVVFKMRGSNAKAATSTEEK
jgi:hypothetical protein